MDAITHFLFSERLVLKGHILHALQVQFPVEDVFVTKTVIIKFYIWHIEINGVTLYESTSHTIDQSLTSVILR